jgi:GTPase SAR1 family protein
LQARGHCPPAPFVDPPLVDNENSALEEKILKLANNSLFQAYKTTTILLDGKRVKLQVWDTSGQGRFCTIIRSYSRGAQGVLLVYDITSKWSFDGIERWVKEVEEVMELLLNRLRE